MQQDGGGHHSGLREMLVVKMRKIHLLRVTCCLAVLAVPLLNFSQTADKDAAKAAFLRDLDSARQGDLDAKLRVARAYNEGTVVWRNAPEAAWWFQQASNEGSMEATAWLGALYLFGGEVPQDIPRATALLQKAVDANNPVGLRFMAAMYQQGIGTAKNPDKAIEFYTRAISQNDSESYARLGRIYLAGLGVPKDPEKSFQLLTKGAQLGNHWAELNLAIMYENGFVPDPHASAGAPAKAAKPDYEKARELFAASAAQGNRVAQYELGRIYDLGLGTPKDYIQSFEYYQQSAMQRYAPAYIALGKAHELGHGTAPNLIHAHVSYSLAVEYSWGGSGKEQLRKLESKMTSAEVQKAHEMLKAFKEASEAAFGRSLK